MTDGPPPSRLLDAVLPHPHFVERHHRTVDAPAADVWAAATAVTPGQIRVLGPLMALRSLPAVLTGRRQVTRRAAETSFLTVFQEEGFVELHRDERVADGRAGAVYGAAGRFWSLSANAPVPLTGPEDWAAHRDPGTVKAAFSLEVAERGGATLVTTETRIIGTDPGARRSFARYWLIIRGPSGLIRRSWLAAIDRQASS